MRLLLRLLLSLFRVLLIAALLYLAASLLSTAGSALSLGLRDFAEVIFDLIGSFLPTLLIEKSTSDLNCET
jgi:hypothetical protein